MVEIDTNILLRYLIKDNASLYDKAKAIIANSSQVYASDLTISEAIYVMTSFYKKDRLKIVEAMQMIFTSKFKLENSTRLVLAFHYFITYPKLSFVDCNFLANLHILQNDMATFDKDLIESLNKANHFDFNSHFKIHTAD